MRRVTGQHGYHRLNGLRDLLQVNEVRSNGAGRALLGAAIRWIEDSSAPRIVLSTAYANGAAKRLFKSTGLRFTMVEMTRDFIDNAVGVTGS